ncbi:succinyldiaminopimelate transaminase [Hamadaea flava]|uniref:Succinyldiaminopimelate transaminase n=1 Tax=Hamadaea flava TaxID=1742688 RepID=A0ABV8LHN0_9ACTN|nr:succinyldiaminopimelate transaminase [Hamadaea flava]MCP2325395.1 succinyldiaminopimelate transaminase [Hamadaea flava]
MSRASAGRRSPAAGLPDVPWDRLEPLKAVAAAHPDGLVDLSMGTPVDSVDPLLQAALSGAADSPGYPLTAGSVALRDAMLAYVRRYCRAGGELGVLPTIGSKELVAWLPRFLGLGPGDTVVIPEVCYPTYEVGALLAGTTVVRADTPPAEPAALVWLNSPGNPHGRVATVAQMRAWVAWARDCGAVIASDECYLSLPWEQTPVSILDPEVCDGSAAGLLAIHSLSKRSNLAGYRAGLVAGDPELVADLLLLRKHAGMIVPAPVQAAMVAALGDEAHADRQREIYRARRGVLRPALEKAGFRIEHSTAGLYLWATRDEPGLRTVGWLADRGVLGVPGEFYGPAGEPFVRLALTASDERIAAAADRILALP